MFTYLLQTPLSHVSIVPKLPSELILTYPLRAIDHETLGLIAQEICDQASQAGVVTKVKISCVLASNLDVEGVASVEMPLRWLNPAQLSELRRAVNRLSR